MVKSEVPCRVFNCKREFLITSIFFQEVCKLHKEKIAFGLNILKTAIKHVGIKPFKNNANVHLQILCW